MSCLIFIAGFISGFLFAKFNVFYFITMLWKQRNDKTKPSILDFFRILKQEMEIIPSKDPAYHTYMELFVYPSPWVITFHRYAHYYYNQKEFFIARAISQFARFLTGIEIHPGAKVGQNVFFDHGMGVVIGETAEIGDECLIFHGVTLGSYSKGQYQQGEKRHPTLLKNVIVGVGSSILGSITIGNNARIGAGSVALKDIGDDCTAVGVPAKVVNQRAASEQTILNFVI